MNTSLSASVENIWLLAGWTMIHFLWLGTLVAVVAFLCRVMLCRASANVRYAVALASLSMFVALPAGIAIWLHQHVPPQDSNQVGIASATKQVAASTGAPVPIDRAAQQVIPNSTPATIELHQPTSPAVEVLGATHPSTATPSVAANPLSLAVAALNTSVQYLPWLWLIGTPVTFALTATGLIGTRRLNRASRVIADGPIVESLAKLAASLKITRRVAVAVCDRIASPVLIGILRPMILLPPAALTGYTAEEIEMVLLHELAHVRRWDNLVNLLQRIVESVLFFHPAVWLLSSWVRREREACCDAIVVTRTDHPHAYAELLVALAAQMPRSVLFHPAASSAMAAGPLRSRIRRILKLDDDPMLISEKSFALILAGLLVAATLTAVYLPTTASAASQDAKREAQTKNNLKDQMLALLNYQTAHKRFPANAIYSPDGKPLLSWRVAILPFIDRKLYDEFHREEPWDSEHNRKLIARMPDIFKNPKLDEPGKTNYLAVVGDECFMTGTPKKLGLANISDGTALTIALVEADPSEAVEWTRPLDWKFDRDRPTHGLGGVWNDHWNHARVDGSLHQVRNNQSADAIGIHFTRNGREQTSLAESANRPTAEAGAEGALGPEGGPAQLGGKDRYEDKSALSEVSTNPMELTPIPASIAAEFRFPVRFEKGAEKFLAGDAITIDEIRGTSGTLEPGNKYWIKGSYKLRSHDRAQIFALTTAAKAEEGWGPLEREQTKQIEGGEGTFTLILPMSVRGWPHVSFYATGGGADFGGVYFGTGDSVLKKWWDPKTAHDHFAAGEAGNREEMEKGLRKLQGELARKFEAYIDFAKSGERDPETDLLLRDIADSQAKVQYLTKAIYQLQADYLVAKRELSDPALFEVQAEESLKNDSRYFELMEKVKSQAAPSDGSEYLAAEKYRADFKKKFTRELQTKPNVPLQQLTQRFNTNAASLRKQVDLLTSNLEKKKSELCKLQDNLVGLERQGGELKEMQQQINETLVKLSELDGNAQPEVVPLVFALKRDQSGRTQLYMNDQPVADGAVRVALGAQGQLIGDTPVSLSVDKAVDYAEVMKVIDLLESLGVKKLSLDTRNVGQKLGKSAPVQSDLNTFTNFEKALSTVEIVVVLFNGTSEQAEALNQVHKELAPKVRSLYTYGIQLDPTSDEANRYRLNGASVCLVFFKGNEIGRFIDIVAPDQLQRHVRDTIKTASAPASQSTTPSPLRKFPTLEDQKLADLGWKRLGLELEPIGEADLKRVKALGYSGGLRVSGQPGTVVSGADQSGAPILTGDILVGLHVWPTTNMKDLAQTLNRDDIEELNPLKFYVVRNEQTGPPTAETPNEATFHDVVHSGRLSVKIGGGVGRGKTSAGVERKPQDRTQPPAERIFVAYNIPPELVAEVKKMPKLPGMQGVFDEQGRYVLQASRERHKQFQQLLDATPKWRDAEAAKQRARQPYVKTEKDGQEHLEWRTAGLTFTSLSNPKFAGANPNKWNGVFVAEVAPGSAADWNGIQPGDLVNKVDEFETNSLAELASLLKVRAEDFANRTVHCMIYRFGSQGMTQLPAKFNLAAANSQPQPATTSAPSANDRVDGQNGSAQQKSSTTPTSQVPSPAGIERGQSIYASIDGVVKKLNVKHNDVVHRNDILLELESPELDKEVETVHGAMKEEAAKLDAATRQLTQGRYRTESGQQKVESEIAQLREGIKSKTKQLELLSTKQGLLIIRSPIDGRIATANVEERLKLRPVNRGELLLELIPNSPIGGSSTTVSAVPEADGKFIVGSVPTTVVVANAEQVKIGKQFSTPVQTTALSPSATKPVPPTPAQNPKESKPSSSGSVIVAHEIPTDLASDVRKYLGQLRDLKVRASWDDRGRLIMQASQDRHDELEKLLKFTSEWRQSIAKQGTAGRVVFDIRKVDGEDVLDLRATGISFAGDDRPNYKTPNMAGGVCVKEVAPGSPAAWIDVRPGDILDRIGAFQATSVSELASIIRTLQEGTAADRKLDLTFYRRKPDGSGSWVVGQLPLVAETNEAELSRERGSYRSERAKRQATSDTAKDGRKQATGPESSAKPGSGATSKAQLLYDGKTFDTWRSTWQTELSTEKRIEAVKALAAFAANGYDQEATDAILDVAGDYDWAIIDSDGEGKLLETILNVLNPSNGGRSKIKNGLAELVRRVETDPTKWQPLADHFFYGLRNADEATMVKLQSLAESGPPQIQPLALAALVRNSYAQNGGKLDTKTGAILGHTLQSKDVATLNTTLPLLIYDPQFGGGGGMASKPQAHVMPEFIPLLFHPDESVKKQARAVLKSVDDESVKPVVKESLAVLKDKSRGRDHIEAVRALAALGTACGGSLERSGALRN